MLYSNAHIWSLFCHPSCTFCSVKEVTPGEKHGLVVKPSPGIILHSPFVTRGGEEVPFSILREWEERGVTTPILSCEFHTSIESLSSWPIAIMLQHSWPARTRSCRYSKHYSRWLAHIQANFYNHHHYIAHTTRLLLIKVIYFIYQCSKSQDTDSLGSLSAYCYSLEHHTLLAYEDSMLASFLASPYGVEKEELVRVVTDS